MNRRRFLIGTAAALGVLGGCSGPDDPTPTGTTPAGPPATTRSTAVSTATETTTSTAREPTAATTETTTTGTTTSTRTPGPGIRNPGFEEGLDGWTVGRDLPEDPNNPGNPVDSRVATTTERALVGQRSLALSIDGSQDDGTLWVQQRSDLSGMEALEVDVFSPSESFNTITKVAAYAGPVRALAEEQFDTSQPVEDHQGWRTYTYPVDHDGAGLVAVGISVVWETEVTRLLDEVTIVRG